MRNPSLEYDIPFFKERSLKKERINLPCFPQGKGITIGIISSSFDARKGAEEDVLRGELPNVQVLKDLSSSSFYADDEGRALAQIVHDVAPQADILFHTAIGGTGSRLDDLNQVSFSAAIDSLKEAGADIIFDDIVGLFPPIFEDSIAAQAVESAVEEGIVYLSAAGNNGGISYESEYRPAAEFLLDGLQFRAHDFDPGVGVDLFQDVQVGEGGIGSLLRPLLSWDSANREDNSELFLFMLDSPTLPTEENVLSISSVPSEITIEDPVASQIYFAVPGQKLYYAIAHVVDFESEPPGKVKWISNSNGSDIGVQYEYIDPLLGTPTIYGQANSESAITVGSASDDGTAYDSFASRGATPILFDEMGNRLPEPIIRRKPDVIGPDNIATAFPEGSQFNPFIGTSAAVAHVAGVVALMEEAAGGPDVLSPEIIKTILGATDKPVEPSPGLPSSAGLVQPDLAILGAKVAGKIASVFPDLSV